MVTFIVVNTRLIGCRLYNYALVDRTEEATLLLPKVSNQYKESNLFEWTFACGQLHKSALQDF